MGHAHHECDKRLKQGLLGKPFISLAARTFWARCVAERALKACPDSFLCAFPVHRGLLLEATSPKALPRHRQFITLRDSKAPGSSLGVAGSGVNQSLAGGFTYEPFLLAAKNRQLISPHTLCRRESAFRDSAQIDFGDELRVITEPGQRTPYSLSEMSESCIQKMVSDIGPECTSTRPA
jgi:hypothetical protein